MDSLNTDLILRPNSKSIFDGEDILDTPYVIKRLIELDDSDQVVWCKWKNNRNQVVVSSNHYIYKVYSEGRQWLHETIIKELADIYASWGIHWKIFIENDDTSGNQIIIEQRQKLDVITDKSNISLNQLLNDWGSTLVELEKRLHIDEVSRYVRLASNGEIWNVRLIRDCVPKFIDYATYNDYIVLLDDADFFVCPLDRSGNWINAKYNFYDLSDIFQDSLYMAPLHILTITSMNSNSTFRYWQIVNIPQNMRDRADQLVNMREQLVNQSINIITQKSNDPVDPYNWLEMSQFKDKEHDRFEPFKIECRQ